MARPLSEIADDILAIEQTLKNAMHSVMQATMAAAGQTPPSDLPDTRTTPQIFVLPGGREIELADIAAELRDHHQHAGDFRER